MAAAEQEVKRLPPLFPRTAEGFAAFYNFMFEPQGFALAPHMYDPVRGLMDTRIPKLLIVLGPGSGKSLLCDVAFPAFEMGHDPTMTLLAVSAGEALMQGFQRAVGDWIENSKRYQAAFPGILPDFDKGWSTERGLFVRGHPDGNPDANYFACGLTSSALTGKHCRTMLGDDLHNKESAASADACQKVKDDYNRTLIGRADPRGCRFIFTGRRWHQEDVYGYLIDSGDWVVMHLPALRENGNNELYWEITIPSGLTCCFNDGTHPTARNA